MSESPKVQTEVSSLNNEDLNVKRACILQQISEIKEKFSPGFDLVKTHFLNKYDDFYSKLFLELKELDLKVNTAFKPDESIVNDYKKNVNQVLDKIYENQLINYQKFLSEMEILSSNLLEKISKENLDNIKNDVQQTINKYLKEQEEKKIEEEKRKKEEKIQYIKNIIKEENNIKKEIKPIIFNIDKKDIKVIELDGKSEDFNKKSQENMDNYNKIILKNISQYDIDLFFSKNTNNIISKKNSDNNDNNNIYYIKIENSNIENLDISKVFSDIIKLKIIESKISFNLEDKINFNNLQNLKLENVGLIDQNFNDLFDRIRSNENLRNNLVKLSVKNNKISYIDYKRGYADNILSSMIFYNLKELDLSYNKLFIFQNQIFNCLESIKLIDLTDNSMAFPQNISGLIKSAKIKKCLLLITRNLAIYKEPENIEYDNYLKEILPEIKYPIKNITFDNIFCGNLYKNILSLDFSFFKDSLNYLNLSNSQLNDKDLISLLNEKWIFPNIKTLILNANYLTEEFLYEISIDNKYKMDKLKRLELSENEIKCSNLDKFKKFLEYFKNLEILELKCTPFEKNVNQYFRKKIYQYRDPQNKKGCTEPFNEEDKKIEEILKENYLKDNTKLTIYILDLSTGKYTDQINQHYSFMMERLKVENKFPNK